MKHVKLLGVLLCLILFVACNGADEYNFEKTDTEAVTGENNVISTEDNGSAVIAGLPEYVPYIVSRGSIIGFGEYIVLIDLLTGDEMATLTLDDDANIVAEVYNFGNGYFGALVGIAHPTSLYFEGLAEDDFDFEAAVGADHEYHLRYLILDVELNILQDLPITNEHLYEPYAHIFTTAVYENGELIVYYSSNYLFHGGGAASVYRYNVHTGASEHLVELGHRITINDFSLIEPELLAFVGGRLDGEEFLMYFGIIHIETGEVTIFTEPSFRYSEVMSARTQVLISEQALASGDRESDLLTFTTERNEIILINTETMERIFIELSDMESAQIQLLQDGRSFVTVTACRSYFRKYDMTDGTSVEMVQQVPLSLNKKGGRIRIYPITDTLFAVHHLERQPDNEIERTVELVVLP